MIQQPYIYMQFIQLPPLQREQDGINSLERRDLISYYAHNCTDDLRGFKHFFQDGRLVAYLQEPNEAYSDADFKIMLSGSDSYENLTTIFKGLRCGSCGVGKGNPNFKNPKSLFYGMDDAYILIHNEDYTNIELLVFVGQKENLGALYNATLDGEFVDLVNFSRLNAIDCYNQRAISIKGGIPLADNWLDFYKLMPHPYLFL